MPLCVAYGALYLTLRVLTHIRVSDFDMRDLSRLPYVSMQLRDRL